MLRHHRPFGFGFGLGLGFVGCTVPPDASPAAPGGMRTAVNVVSAGSGNATDESTGIGTPTIAPPELTLVSARPDESTTVLSIPDPFDCLQLVISRISAAMQRRSGAVAIEVSL
jgi:hypothetical protein